MRSEVKWKDWISTGTHQWYQHDAWFLSWSGATDRAISSFFSLVFKIASIIWEGGKKDPYKPSADETDSNCTSVSSPADHQGAHCTPTAEKIQTCLFYFCSVCLYFIFIMCFFYNEPQTTKDVQVENICAHPWPFLMCNHGTHAQYKRTHLSLLSFILSVWIHI